MAEREYVGCIHVHSDFSDGAAPAEEIVRIAAQSGLDYVVISDHRSDGARSAGLTGWHGGLLCVSAPEIGGKAKPHFLMFCPRSIDGLSAMPEAQALEAAAGQGAMTFVAHPHPATLRFYKQPPVGWTGLDRCRFDGLEIWSYLHDICHKLNVWRLAKVWWRHEELIRGPRAETLQVWDELCRHRRVAGIAALDNHAHPVPFFGATLPHADLFGLLRTHVVCETLPTDNDEAERALSRALADGKGFAAMDGWGDAAGFRLRVEGPGASLGFGEEAAFAGGMRLIVTSPCPADLRVVRDGQTIEERGGARALELPLERPGVYRVEGRRDRRPWLFTNPIYLREADHVSDTAS